MYIFWRRKLGKRAMMAQQAFGMTTSFGYKNDSLKKSVGRSSFVMPPPSSEIFIAMSQGNESSNSEDDEDSYSIGRDLKDDVSESLADMVMVSSDIVSS
jgi:hypothetical protein